jgi:multicomponent Na+:H+ antiporter subunit B
MDMSVDPHLIVNIGLLLLLLTTSLAVVVLRDVLAGIIIFSIFSLLMAMLYVVLEAPDVAITEAAVGAGVSTIVLVAALLLTGREKDRPRALRPGVLLMVLLMGAALLYATSHFPPFGDPDSPASTHVAPAYLELTPVDIGIPNVVTAVLASYRGFDTLGETTVVFTALVAVWLILGPLLPASPSSVLRKPPSSGRSRKGGDHA